MGEISINTSKWGRNLKYIVGIAFFILLMFAGYKIFVPKEYSDSQEVEKRLILAKEQVRVLKDSITVINKYNDSIGDINDRNYQAWKKDRDNFKKLKTQFDEVRKRNNDLSPDDRVRLLSGWLNE